MREVQAQARKCEQRRVGVLSDLGGCRSSCCLGVRPERVSDHCAASVQLERILNWVAFGLIRLSAHCGVIGNSTRKK